MAVCCCALAGTAACQHCSQNQFATDVWTNGRKLHAMSDEQFAKWLADTTLHWEKWCDKDAPEDPETGVCQKYDGECWKCVLDWLNKEAET